MQVHSILQGKKSIRLVLHFDRPYSEQNICEQQILWGRLKERKALKIPLSKKYM